MCGSDPRGGDKSPAGYRSGPPVVQVVASLLSCHGVPAGAGKPGRPAAKPARIWWRWRFKGLG